MASGRSAFAGDPRSFVTLTYDIDPALAGCPSEADFRSAVVARLGYSPFHSGSAHRIVASVRRADPGLQGQLDWTDAVGASEGQRRLSSVKSDCREFVRGMAFVLAVQIQLLPSAPSEPVAATSLSAPTPTASSVPEAATATATGTSDSLAPARESNRPSPAESAPTSPRPPKDVPSAAASPTAREEPDHTNSGAKPPDRSVSLGVGITGSVGSGPDWTAGGRIFVAARSHAISLELAAQGDLPVNFRQPDGTGFSLSTLGVSLAPCGHLSHFALCAVGILGLVQVNGTGVDVPRSPAAAIAKAGLRATFEQRLSERFALLIHADGLSTLTPRTVDVNDLPIWTTPTFGASLGADLAVLFR